MAGWFRYEIADSMRGEHRGSSIPLIPNNYYGPEHALALMIDSGGGSAGPAMLGQTTGNPWLLPFIVPHRARFDKLIGDIIAADVGKLYVAIYDCAFEEALPKNLIMDCGYIDTNNSGGVEITLPQTLSLPHGLYWLALGPDYGQATMTSCSVVTDVRSPRMAIFGSYDAPIANVFPNVAIQMTDFLNPGDAWPQVYTGGIAALGWVAPWIGFYFIGR